jgi:hypothetical protein
MPISQEILRATQNPNNSIFQTCVLIALKQKFSHLNDIISQGKVELGNARDGLWELAPTK